MNQGIAILGVYVADLAFRANRQPVLGETLMGSGFKMGPGGKGSNQSVAAARAGAKVSFISRLGRDAFGDIALATWKAEDIAPRVAISDKEPTGAAYIFVSDETGENAIIVVPGAGGGISAGDVEAQRAVIEGAQVFVTQLEQSIEAARKGLEIARAAGVITVFNPAPAASVPDDIYGLCDYVIPNESEATALTGLPVTTLEEARA
uniref:ribokinase n=1 Tax=Aestuariivirga sp. TaxID=2650926 RepID=UPI003592ED17